ncbi:MAG: hypothetical protein ACRCW0_04495 [Clostridium sp.]
MEKFKAPNKLVEDTKIKVKREIDKSLKYENILVYSLIVGSFLLCVFQSVFFKRELWFWGNYFVKNIVTQNICMIALIVFIGTMLNLNFIKLGQKDR